jgi:hypothetical protein
MHLFRCRACGNQLAYPGLCLICRENLPKACSCDRFFSADPSFHRENCEFRTSRRLAAKGEK